MSRASLPFTEDGPAELYDPEAERPYCDRCGCYHGGVCFDEDPPEPNPDPDFDVEPDDVGEECNQRGRIVRDATPEDGCCKVCDSELGHLPGYVAIPAAFIADLFASDYAGLNMGIDEDQPATPICWECASNCVPWAVSDDGEFI